MDNQQLIDLIEDILFMEGTASTQIEDQLTWKDAFGAEVSVCHIAANGPVIAWYQQHEVGKDLLRVKYGNYTVNWSPVGNYQDWGSRCTYLAWHGDHLICIYQEKHGYYAVSAKNTEFKTIRFYDSHYTIEENILSFKHIEGDQIRNVQLPALEDL